MSEKKDHMMSARRGEALAASAARGAGGDKVVVMTVRGAITENAFAPMNLILTEENARRLRDELTVALKTKEF